MKINRMSNAMIKEKLAELDAGQVHIYKNSNDKEIRKLGASHKNSKHYGHLVEELNRREQ